MNSDISICVITSTFILCAILLVLYDCLSKLREQINTFKEIFTLCNKVLDSKEEQLNNYTIKKPEISPTLDRITVICYYCGRPGHVFYYCYPKVPDLKSEDSDDQNEESNNEDN